MGGSPDLVLAAFHWLELLGLLGGIGAAVIRRLGRVPPRLTWAEPPMHVAFAAAVLGGLGLLALGPSWFLLARVLAEGAALFLCVRGRRFAPVFAVLAAGLLPLTGHAAAITPESPGAIFADVLHVLSAAMWAGAILAMASLQPPEGWTGGEARSLLMRFGRVALIAFGITALTGVLRATEQLHDVSDLWSTPYGIVLGLKSAGVLAMLALSAAWRAGRPVARTEAAVGLLVVGATALLAAFPVQA